MQVFTEFFRFKFCKITLIPFYLQDRKQIFYLQMRLPAVLIAH